MTLVYLIDILIFKRRDSERMAGFFGNSASSGDYRFTHSREKRGFKRLRPPPLVTDMSQQIQSTPQNLRKHKTGVHGLDEVTGGGLPHGRPTLICGGPGCGKTMLAMEFLCRGARQFDEPGLYVSFEEAVEDIQLDFAATRIGLHELTSAKLLAIKSIVPARDRPTTAGEFTLDGLLIRLDHWIKTTGAQRLALDSLDSLFSAFGDGDDLRRELARLFGWIREKGITTVVTAEREKRGIDSFGLEEYASDCVILLDHRISEQISKRRIRILKYRGSAHGSDEYPFIIGAKGISVLPITSTGLDAPASQDFVSTGITGLDSMLGGKGPYAGSTVLISGVAGTGKSTIAARIIESMAAQEKRGLYLPFEEPTRQLVRDMRSVGIDLETPSERGMVRIAPLRPNAFGLEEHLMRIELLVEEFEPEIVVMDPVTSFTPVGSTIEIKGMLVRLLHYLKSRGVTVIMPSLTRGSGTEEESDTEVSSLVDTWIIIRFIRERGVRRRQLYVHKARGIDHSQAIGELKLSHKGPLVRDFGGESGGEG